MNLAQQLAAANRLVVYQPCPRANDGTQYGAILAALPGRAAVVADITGLGLPRTANLLGKLKGMGLVWKQGKEWRRVR